ncbi:hypothetical protein JAAARDRAFT_530645 [Jaapia argillacea MUCL 33604]|uniref:Uncharacterized protein n=1 Tax=Jaapia argillacea MUCL 33604 TaxID=933084 RepID=A0A067P987_9AGAM|nr:hypothetical protein JAAARDRAFT_530645 [Jaapia argillacea MUCL 33604]
MPRRTLCQSTVLSSMLAWPHCSARRMIWLIRLDIGPLDEATIHSQHQDRLTKHTDQLPPSNRSGQERITLCLLTPVVQAGSG